MASILSTLSTGTVLHYPVGSGFQKRVYQCVWNAETRKITWDAQEFASLNKWIRAIRELHNGSAPRTVSTLPCYIYQEGVKVHLSALKPATPPRGDSPLHWIVRVGNGSEFWSSAPYNVWCANSKDSRDIHFLNNARQGDFLWFCTRKSKGHLIAVATYTGRIQRSENDLLGLSHTNQQLGWAGDKPMDTEITYTNLYDIRGIGGTGLLSNCKHFYSKSRYDCPSTRCDVDLPTEYVNIQRYAPVFKMPASPLSQELMSLASFYTAPLGGAPLGAPPVL